MVSINSDIEWTHHSFNPWQGCVKVGPECAHCYAETFDKRRLYSRETHWGKNATRLFQSDPYWKQPDRWNRRAEKLNERHRVFCASLADVFENRDDLQPHRQRLWGVIHKTPMLDWLLLTKRPQNIRSMLPDSWLKSPQHNVWLGTSVGVKDRLDDTKELCAVPAVVHFLSVEPLLEDLGDIDLTGVDWVIVGGESGPGARPMEADWVRSIRDRCIDRHAAFFFKQWGKLINNPDQKDPTAKKNGGTAKGGRMLDGMVWDEMPSNIRTGVCVSTNNRKQVIQ